MPTSYTESDVAESPTAVHVAAGQRPVLVRQRPQVQALPQAARGPGAAGRRQPAPPGARPHRPSAVRRHRRARPVGRAAGQDARDHRAHAPRRRRRRRGAAPRRRDGRRRASPPTRSTCTSTTCASSATRIPSPLNYNRFPKSVCTSVNEVICHGIPDSRALQDGDIVNLDVTTYIGGVHGDTNATFFVGDVDPASQPAGASHRGVHVARHRGGAARAARSATSAGPSRTHAKKHQLRRGAGVHRPRHRRAVPHRPPGPALLRRAGQHDHAAGHDVHDRADDHARHVAAQDGVDDDWTAVTADGKRTAQFEHTILVTDDGFDVLTAPGAVSPSAPWHR